MDKVHITLQKGQKLFFSSDPHYGHNNILRFCHRPFQDMKHMCESLINNWNSVVSNEDICFILGDVMWWESRHDAKRVLEKLNGKEIHIIPGNHDKIKTFELLSERFIIHDSIVTVWINEHDKKGVNELFLCHFPMATWPHFEKASIHLFGHIHSGPLSENAVDVPGQDLILKTGRCYDVGVDNNNFFPIEIRDVYNKLGVEWR